jgi:radical SAM superfamily enzyme YgiQ (UPF0313 family)
MRCAPATGFCFITRSLRPINLLRHGRLSAGFANNMNVLLIYPEFPDSFWSFKHALPFIGKKAAHPPLGLLTVAAMLPTDWQLRLVDTNVRELTNEDLAWAQIALISAMGVQRPSALSLIERCQSKGIRVVAGGSLFTAQPEQFPQVDHVISGEAEVVLARFLDDLAKGCAKHFYKADAFADLKDSPIPRWDLVTFDDYGTMSIQYSRGCPYDCEFCDITALFGRRPRNKAAKQVINELESLYTKGWRGGVFFVDDNLIGNKKELKTELMPALLAWQTLRPGFEFNTQTSINLADDDELMSTMVKVGFDSVFVGIETPSQESLAECSKRHNLGRDMRADVRRMQKAGLQVQAGFIVGFDSDTASTFDRLTEFIQSTGITTAMVGVLQAIPGTRLHERLKGSGRLVELGSGYDVNGTTNIVPIMDLSVLHTRYRELISRLYSPRNYYQRVKLFLGIYEIPRLRIRWDLQHQLRQWFAFASASVRLGVAGQERFEYWKLLFWTMFRRPRAFSLAVTLAIYGYHFRISSERCLASK